MELLKFGNGYVISSHTLLGMWLLLHAGIVVNHVSKTGPSYSGARKKYRAVVITWIDFNFLLFYLFLLTKKGVTTGIN